MKQRIVAPKPAIKQLLKAKRTNKTAIFYGTPELAVSDESGSSRHSERGTISSNKTKPLRPTSAYKTLGFARENQRVHPNEGRVLRERDFRLSRLVHAEARP